MESNILRPGSYITEVFEDFYGPQTPPLSSPAQSQAWQFCRSCTLTSHDKLKTP